MGTFLYGLGPVSLRPEKRRQPDWAEPDYYTPSKPRATPPDYDALLADMDSEMPAPSTGRRPGPAPGVPWDWGGLDDTTSEERYATPLQRADLRLDEGGWRARAQGTANAMRILDEIYGGGRKTHEQVQQDDLRARQHMAAIEDLMPADPRYAGTPMEGLPSSHARISSGSRTVVPRGAAERAAGLEEFREGLPEDDERIAQIMEDITRSRELGETPVAPRGRQRYEQQYGGQQYGGGYYPDRQARERDEVAAMTEDYVQGRRYYAETLNALDDVIRATEESGADTVTLPFEYEGRREVPVEVANQIAEALRAEQEDFETRYGLRFDSYNVEPPGATAY